MSLIVLINLTFNLDTLAFKISDQGWTIGSAQTAVMWHLGCK